MRIEFETLAELVEFHKTFCLVDEGMLKREKPKHMAQSVILEPVEAEKPKPVEVDADGVEVDADGVEVDADGVEVDADGVEWNEELHSSNKAKTKDGKWRRRRGVTTVSEPNEPEQTATAEPEQNTDEPNEPEQTAEPEQTTDEPNESEQNTDDKDELLQKIYDMLSDDVIDMIDLQKVLGKHNIQKLADLKEESASVISSIIDELVQ